MAGCQSNRRRPVTDLTDTQRLVRPLPPNARTTAHCRFPPTSGVAPRLKALWPMSARPSEARAVEEAPPETQYRSGGRRRARGAMTLRATNAAVAALGRTNALGRSCDTPRGEPSRWIRIKRASRPPDRKFRAGTKQARMIAMLQAPGGATIAEIAEAMEWEPHTVRGAIAGALKKRLGLERCLGESRRTRALLPHRRVTALKACRPAQGSGGTSRYAFYTCFAISLERRQGGASRYPPAWD